MKALHFLITLSATLLLKSGAIFAMELDEGVSARSSEQSNSRLFSKSQKILDDFLKSKEFETVNRSLSHSLREELNTEVRGDEQKRRERGYDLLSGLGEGSFFAPEDILHQSINRYAETVRYGLFPLCSPKIVTAAETKPRQLEYIETPGDNRIHFFEKLLVKYVELYRFVPPKDSSLRALNRDKTEKTKVKQDKIVAKYNSELGQAVFFIEEFYPKFYATMVEIGKNAEEVYPWLRNRDFPGTAPEEENKYSQPSPEAQKTLDEFFKSEEFLTVECSLNAFHIVEKNSATEGLKIKFPGGDPRTNARQLAKKGYTSLDASTLRNCEEYRKLGKDIDKYTKLCEQQHILRESIKKYARTIERQSLDGYSYLTLLSLEKVRSIKDVRELAPLTLDRKIYFFGKFLLKCIEDPENTEYFDNFYTAFHKAMTGIQEEATKKRQSIHPFPCQ